MPPRALPRRPSQLSKFGRKVSDKVTKTFGKQTNKDALPISPAGQRGTLRGGTVFLRSKKNQKTIPFPVNKDYKLAIGFSSLELNRPSKTEGKNIDFNLVSYQQNEDQTTGTKGAIEMQLQGLSDVSAVVATYLRIPTVEKQVNAGFTDCIQTGVVSSDPQQRNIVEPASLKVEFERGFARSPKIMLWLKGFEIGAESTQWAILLNPSDVTKSGFRVKIGLSTDGKLKTDCDLKRIEVTWIAIPYNDLHYVNESAGGQIKKPRTKDPTYPLYETPWKLNPDAGTPELKYVWLGVREFWFLGNPALDFHTGLADNPEQNTLDVRFQINGKTADAAKNRAEYWLSVDYICNKTQLLDGEYEEEDDEDSGMKLE